MGVRVARTVCCVRRCDGIAADAACTWSRTIPGMSTTGCDCGRNSTIAGAFGAGTVAAASRVWRAGTRTVVTIDFAGAGATGTRSSDGAPVHCGIAD